MICSKKHWIFYWINSFFENKRRKAIVSLLSFPLGISVKSKMIFCRQSNHVDWKWNWRRKEYTTLHPTAHIVFFTLQPFWHQSHCHKFSFFHIHRSCNWLTFYKSCWPTFALKVKNADAAKWFVGFNATEFISSDVYFFVLLATAKVNISQYTYN